MVCNPPPNTHKVLWSLNFIVLQTANISHSLSQSSLTNWLAICWGFASHAYQLSTTESLAFEHFVHHTHNKHNFSFPNSPRSIVCKFRITLDCYNYKKLTCCRNLANFWEQVLSFRFFLINQSRLPHQLPPNYNTLNPPPHHQNPSKHWSSLRSVATWHIVRHVVQYKVVVDFFGGLH